MAIKRDILPHINGTTFSGFKHTLKYADGSPFIITGSKVTMQLREKAESLDFIEFSTDNGQISIIGTNTYQFNEQVIYVEIPKTYVYDILLELPNGKKFVFLYGKFPIIQKITRYV